ncbi:MAG TPA: DUF2950 domain-containing protein [Candidatus Acidoferrum sp.]|nr:DUF2950 domain-containing protein [Candidatus Acidoferrum sp.]
MIEKIKSAGGVGLMALGLAGLALAPGTALARDGEERFATPEAAETALAAAAKSMDTNAMTAIFGPASRELVSPDPVQASHGYSNFVRRLVEKVDLVRRSDSKMELQIGVDAWPFPIPLVQDKGEWFFDTAAGREEILNRRIGADELGAIRVCRAYVEAQREYAGEARNAEGVLEYAQHLRSTTNTHDGLYWHAEPGAEVSPFGPLIAQSHDEGYRHEAKIMGGNLAPYRGYCFKILTRQGPHAPGGKYNYIINGHMLAGFALAAWPAEWGNTGVMTFMVNQQGKVYEKNLGPKTGRLAAAMTTYDPDKTWQPTTGN